MHPALAAYTVGTLRSLSVEEVDRRLCAMHRDDLHALGDVLGIKLPNFGGDKPALVGAALLAARGRS